MIQEKVTLGEKKADGYVIPLRKSLNLVFVVTDAGMVSCGAFDVAALDKFSYPAARVRSADGSPIVIIADLLQGVVKEANPAAIERGIEVGMSGKEALERL